MVPTILNTNAVADDTSGLYTVITLKALLNCKSACAGIEIKEATVMFTVIVRESIF